MDAAKIDHQLAADVHPDIVITDELEHIAGIFVIGEFCLQLEGEVEVAIRRASGISEELIFNRKEPAQVAVLRIQRVVEHIGPVGLPYELQCQRLGEIPATAVIVDTNAKVPSPIIPP